MNDKPYKIEVREPKNASITLRVSRSLLDAYEELSTQSGQSRNQLINMAMEAFLKNVMIEKKKS